jgi:hypothetical protein
MGRAGIPVGNGDQRRQPLDGRELGTVAHVAIGELLAAGVRRPTADEIMKLVGRHRLLQTVTLYRQAAKQKLVGAVAVYFRFFALDEEWRFVGAEVPVRGGRFDLVFEGTDDRVLVDELKTGRIQTVEERRAAEEQLRRRVALVPRSTARDSLACASSGSVRRLDRCGRSPMAAARPSRGRREGDARLLAGDAEGDDRAAPGGA